MATMPSGVVRFQYHQSPTNLTRAKVIELATADWRKFCDDPEAELPWTAGIELRVLPAEEGPLNAYAEVTVRWDKADR